MKRFKHVAVTAKGDNHIGFLRRDVVILCRQFFIGLLRRI